MNEIKWDTYLILPKNIPPDFEEIFWEHHRQTTKITVLAISANILAVKEGNENSDKIVALINALMEKLEAEIAAAEEAEAKAKEEAEAKAKAEEEAKAKEENEFFDITVSEEQVFQNQTSQNHIQQDRIPF